MIEKPRYFPIYSESKINIFFVIKLITYQFKWLYCKFNTFKPKLFVQ